MLARFIEGQPQLRREIVASVPNRELQTLHAVGYLFDFLADEKLFCNPHINQLCSFAGKFVTDELTAGRIPLALMPGVNEMMVSIAEWTNQEGVLQRQARIIVPADFLTETDIARQMGEVAHVASKLWDFAERQPRGEAYEVRAKGYQAEVLHQIKRELSSSYTHYEFSERDEEIMNRYPHGIRSIPSGYNVSTRRLTGILGLN